MGSFSIGAGFVVAAFVVIVFLSNRLGGDTELLRRGIQVAIGFALFLLAISATTAIIRPPESLGDTSSVFNDNGDSEQYLSEIAADTSAAGTVHVAVGIILAIVGAMLFKRMQVIPLGLMLGGLLLLLLGAPPGTSSTDPLSSYYALIVSAVGHPDLGWDIARLTVMAAGTVALIMYAFYEYEVPASGSPPESPDEPEPSPAV